MIDLAGVLAGEGESRWEGIGLGKLPGMAEGVGICGDELGTDAEAVRRLVRSSMGTGVARELGAGAFLTKRPFLSRGGWVFLLIHERGIQGVNKVATGV
jgi:hypothetical protein